MRLAIVIAGLSGGGAERVASSLAGDLAERGHRVTLITLDGTGDDFYAVAPSVQRVRIAGTGVTRSRLGRLKGELTLLRRMRRALTEASVEAAIAFSTETSVRTIMAAAALDVRVVAAERSDPSQHDPGAVWRLLRRHLYRFASTTVVQTPEAREWIAGNTSARRVAVIPNSVAIGDRPAGAPNRTNPRPAVAGLGRFRPEKGFDRLIEAFALVNVAHPEWHLVLAGEGPEEARLRGLVAERGLGARVRFVGPVTDAAAFLADADVFALPSRYEGFPNALLEAMACGLPPVSFDSPGPRAIVRDGTDGLLVPGGEVTDFATALGSLMADAVRRRRLGVAARDVRERFAPRCVLPRWAAVLEP